MMCRLPPGPAMHPFLGPVLVAKTLNNTFQMLGNYVQCFLATLFRGLGQPACLSTGQQLQ